MKSTSTLTCSAQIPSRSDTSTIHTRSLDCYGKILCLYMGHCDAAADEVTDIIQYEDIPAISSFYLVPTEILFLIFYHLLPSDIISISRTSKAFRALLLSRQSISVWKAARANIWKAPACPPDMSEPQWANLLWGDTLCEVCNGGDVDTVNFALRRRVCVKCLSRRLVKLPEDDAEVFKYVPYTTTKALLARDDYMCSGVEFTAFDIDGSYANAECACDDRTDSDGRIVCGADEDHLLRSYWEEYIGDAHRGSWDADEPNWSIPPYYLKVFWDDDVEDMKRQLAFFEKAVALGEPKALEALEAFKNAQLVKVKEIVRHGEICDAWALQTSAHEMMKGIGVLGDRSIFCM